MRRMKASFLAHWREFIQGEPDEKGLLEFVARRNDSLDTEEIPGTKHLSTWTPQTRFDLARTLFAAMEKSVPDWFDDDGLLCWADLAFHEVTFYKPGGKFFVGNPARHLLDYEGTSKRKGVAMNHRHLIRLPLRIFSDHKHLSAGVLCNHPCDPSKLEENLSARKGSDFAFLRTNEFMRLIDILFVSRNDGRLRFKTGAGEAFVRMVEVCSQIDAVVDLGSMSHQDIIAKLPKEFATWKPTLS